MQVADAFEVFPMLDGDALEEVVRRHAPDFIVPEVEAIRTERLRALEEEGFHVVPTAEAAWRTMDREAIREMAARELGLRTARFAFADDLEELRKACDALGYPVVVKPVMSSSGKGQSTVTGPTRRWTEAWERALEAAGGTSPGSSWRSTSPFTPRSPSSPSGSGTGRPVSWSPSPTGRSRGTTGSPGCPPGSTPEVASPGRGPWPRT
jgi:hypothetical protein